MLRLPHSCAKDACAKMAAMRRFRHNHCFRRLIILAVALLISNIAAASCAMAYALCTECPEHVPALCESPCLTTDITVIDKTVDTKSDAHRPVAFTHAVLPLDPVDRTAQAAVVDNKHLCNFSSPPLHLQFCVFLK
jgi:hypothetical protein